MRAFLGRIVENKFFSKTGFIDVVLYQTLQENNISDKYRYELTHADIKDAIPNYEEGFHGDGDTIKCRIVSGFGNGKNYGMMHIPQINSVGLVLLMDDGINIDLWGGDSRAFWIGGLYGGFSDLALNSDGLASNKLELPKDDTEDEMISYKDGTYSSLEDGEEDDISTSPYINEGMFLIRLKTCKTSSYDSDLESTEEKHIHYDTTPGESSFSMRKTKISLRYNVYDDNDTRTSISDFTMDKGKTKILRFVANDIEEQQNEEEQQEQSKMDETRTEQYLVFNDDIVELKFHNKKKQKENVLSFDKDGNGKFTYTEPKSAISRGIEWTSENLTINFNQNNSTNAKITLNNEGSIIITGTKDLNIEVVDGEANIKSTKCNIEATDEANIKTAKCVLDSQDTTITGGKLTINGTAIPSGQGVLCSMPFCAFTGAPQTGFEAQGC